MILYDQDIYDNAFNYEGGITYERTIEEVISVEDVRKSTIQRTFAEIVSASDSIVKRLSRTINETLSSSDSLSKSIVRTFLDVIASSDSRKVYLNGVLQIWEKLKDSVSPLWKKIYNAHLYDNEVSYDSELLYDGGIKWNKSNGVSTTWSSVQKPQTTYNKNSKVTTPWTKIN